MKKIGKILLVILEVIIVIYVIGITTCLLCTNKFGQTQFGKKTWFTATEANSANVAEFTDNSLVIFESVKFIQAAEGDVVYYYDTDGDSYIIRKGTIKSKNGDPSSGLYIMEENGVSVVQDRVAGKLVVTYDGWGGILNFLVSRIGFLFFVILPILLLLIYQFYKMVLLIKETK